MKTGKRRIGLVSLGCAKNLVDSELLLKQLEVNNFEFIHDPENFSGIHIAIINTCGFIGDAKKESVDTILEFVNAKKHHKIENVFVMGCLSERYQQELKNEIPEVDAFFGVNDLKKIISHLGGNYRQDLYGERKLTTPPHYAYLKISEGCDRQCSFCTIPSIRGNHISRPIEELVRETTDLVRNGVKEVILIAQDSTYYGLDLYQKRLLPELLDSLANIVNEGWLRLHYTYPHGFPLHLAEVIRSHRNICKYIDIPLQHISNRILKSMRRGMDGKSTRNLVEHLREVIPGVALRTTFIVGYPGETDKEFKELYDFMESTGFERAGVFKYSHEENTPSWKFKDSVSKKVKQERMEILMSLQESISLKQNLLKVGTVQTVLIDRQEGDYFAGRTEIDSPEIDHEVLIPVNGTPLKPGNFCRVRIVKAEPFDLYGELM